MNRGINDNAISETEFYDWANQLLDDLGEEPNKSENVNVHEQIYRRAGEIKLPANMVAYYRNALLDVLLQFGTDLKGQWKANGEWAEREFQRALRLDRNLPIAYYRLGHIAFNRRNFSEAIGYFQQALDCAGLPKFSLQAYQADNAAKVLAYCLIQQLEWLRPRVKTGQDYPELDPIIRDYMRAVKPADRVVAHLVYANGQLQPGEEVTYQQYLAIKDDVDHDPTTAYLDSYHGSPAVGYMGREADLERSRVVYTTLCRLLGLSAEPYTSTRTNTLNQQMVRLRSALSQCCLTPNLLRIVNEAGEPPRIETDLTIHIFRQISE